MVIDLNKFEPRRKLAPGLLWVVEQVSGHISIWGTPVTLDPQTIHYQLILIHHIPFMDSYTCFNSIGGHLPTNPELMNWLPWY